MEIIERLEAYSKITVDEVFHYNCYDVLPGELVGSTVIDVGANVGVFSIFAVMNGAKQVYAYEPDPSNYDKLVDFVSGFKNIKAINLAVVKPGLSQVYLSDSGTTICKVSETGDLAGCTSLEELLRDIPGDDLLLKLDCEGSEY